MKKIYTPKKIILFVISLALIVCSVVFYKNTPMEKRKRMKLVYEQTEKTELLLGLWETPVRHLVTTQEDMDRRYAEIVECGMNLVYLRDFEVNDFEQLTKTLNAAEKNGVKLLVSLPKSSIEKSLAIVEKTKDYPAVFGYNLVDEPRASTFDYYAQLCDAIKAIVPEDKVIMGNLLPNYAAASVYETTSSEGMTIYENYIDLFMNKVKPDVLSFDHYPFMASTDTDFSKISLMIENFCIIRNAGKQYNLDTWGFVQDSSWTGTRIPNDDELRFLSNFHLIFGLKSYSYFLYCQPSNEPGPEGIFEGMLTFDGEQTDIYRRVQKQNKDINAMKGVYLNYENEGFILHNLNFDHEISFDRNLVFKTYKNLNKVSSKGSLVIGCFDKDGKTGLYVMNFDYTNSTTATLELDNKCDFKVWGADGLEQMDKEDSITIKLRPGEGRFIELN